MNDLPMDTAQEEAEYIEYAESQQFINKEESI